METPVEGSSTARVIDFVGWKQENAGQRLSGIAICINCQRQWAATAPVGSVWLDCPSCTLRRGRFLNHAEIREGAHWTCTCGCNLFFIAPDWDVYCPNCGLSQDFPDPPPINDLPAV